MNTLGHTLTKLMAERKIGQEALSKLSGVPQPTISRIRKGIVAEPRSGTLERLAHALGVTIEQLLGNMGPVSTKMESNVVAILTQQEPSAATRQVLALQELERALPQQLKAYVDGFDQVDNIRFKINYLSPTLAVDLGSPRRFSGTAISTNDVYKAYVNRLWRLSCHRRLTQSKRQYVMFIHLEQEALAGLAQMVAQLTVEAAAHNITVIPATLTQAVQFIIDTEMGTGAPNWEDAD